MVAYFRKQTWLFMLGGFAAAMVVAAICWQTILAGEKMATRLIFILMLGLIGAVAGRVQAAKYANRRLEALSARLYRDCDPQGFLQAFEPIAAATSPDNVVFADAQTKISYAYEALGDFDKALAALEPVKPERMKRHSLQVSAILQNHRTRVLLMKEDIPAAEASLREMEALEEKANAQVKALGNQLHACNALARSWLTFLKGETPDAECLMKEAELAKNDIYRAEMELLLGRISAAAGDAEQARAYYAQAAARGHELYAGSQARARLDDLQRKA